MPTKAKKATKKESSGVHVWDLDAMAAIPSDPKERVVHFAEIAKEMQENSKKQWESIFLSIKIPELPKFDFVEQIKHALETNHIHFPQNQLAEAFKQVKFDFKPANSIYLDVAKYDKLVPPINVSRSNERIAETIIESVRKIGDSNQQKQIDASYPRLVEFVAGHLRILEFYFIFDGIPKDIIQFFYSDPDRGSWKSYADMQELRDETMVTNTRIREAIDDINHRVFKETNGKIKALIASRQRGSSPTSPKEYRYTL